MKRYDLISEFKSNEYGEWVDADEALARIDALQKENVRLRGLVARGAGMTATVPEMGHNAYAAECAAECEKWGKE